MAASMTFLHDTFRAVMVEGVELVAHSGAGQGSRQRESSQGVPVVLWLTHPTPDPWRGVLHWSTHVDTFPPPPAFTTSVHVEQIASVAVGKTTPSFRAAKSAEIAEDSFCFSLVFKPGMGPVGAGTLDVEATAALEQQVLVEGFELMMKHEEETRKANGSNNGSNNGALDAHGSGHGGDNANASAHANAHSNAQEKPPAAAGIGSMIGSSGILHWLTQIGLEDYVHVFTAEGFDDVSCCSRCTFVLLCFIRQFWDMLLCRHHRGPHAPHHYRLPRSSELDHLKAHILSFHMVLLPASSVI